MEEIVVTARRSSDSPGRYNPTGSILTGEVRAENAKPDVEDQLEARRQRLVAENKAKREAAANSPAATEPGEPTGGGGFLDTELLEEIIVTAAAKTATEVAKSPGVVSSALAIATRFMPWLGLFIPSSIGDATLTAEERNAGSKPSVDDKTSVEAPMEEVVVEASPIVDPTASPSPQYKVGKAQPFVEFGDIPNYRDDTDLIGEPIWDPTTSPSVTTTPSTPSRTTPSPSTKPTPLPLPTTLPSILPKSNLSTASLPLIGTSSDSLPKSSPRARSGRAPSKRYTRGSRPVFQSPEQSAPINDPTFSYTPTPSRSVTPTPSEKPEETAFGCPACPPCSKESKAEQEKQRTVCYVKLTKERKNPSSDKSTNWRQIKCQ